MDNKEDMDSDVRGFIGVIRQSIKMILSHRKLFAKIVLYFILPLNIFTLACLVSFKLIFNDISDIITLNKDTNVYSSKPIISHSIFLAISMLFSLKYSVVSISTVAYSTSCIYIGEEITFLKARSVARQVYKRVAITMASQMLVTSGFNYVVGKLCGIFVTMKFELPLSIIIVIILLPFLGIMYLNISWQLANIIAVVEDYSGFEAMKKSRQLMKGNFGRAIALLLMVPLLYTPTFIMIQRLLFGVDGDNFGEIRPIMILLYGIVSLVYDPLVMLFGLVVQTTFYIGCKSYHRESIEISSLTQILDLSKSNGDYVPLKNEGDEKIIQLDV